MKAAKARIVKVRIVETETRYRFRCEVSHVGDRYRVRQYAKQSLSHSAPQSWSDSHSSRPRWVLMGILNLRCPEWLAWEKLLRGCGVQIVDQGEVRVTESEWGRARREAEEFAKSEAKRIEQARGV